MKVYVIGVGMGNVNTLTVGALHAIESSEMLIGAQRLLDVCSQQSCQKRALVRVDDIVRATEDAHTQALAAAAATQG